MNIYLDWSTIGPPMAAAAAGIVGWMVRALWTAIGERARQADLDKLEQRFDHELSALAFKLDRYEENCAARWVHRSASES